MKSTVKKILLTLSAVMLFAVALCFNASALDETGSCGGYVTWNFDKSSGTLTLSGVGEGSMRDYYNQSPFYNDNSIKNVVIGDGIKSIGYGAFKNCNSIESISIADSVTNINDYAFYECTSLKSIVIPKGVTTIGEFSFSGCTSLENIEIADSVTRIGAYAFENTAYYNNESNWEDNILYIGNKLISTTDDIFGECKIKEGTKILADRAFWNLQDIISVTFPDSIISIGGAAFEYCENLKSLTFGKGLTSVGSNSFDYCDNLNEITILNDTFAFSSVAFSEPVIRCYKNSLAHKKAVEVNLPFALIDGTDEESICSGTIGKFSWMIDKRSGVLEIDGNGAMINFGNAGVPWKEYDKFIKTIKYSEGITTLMEYHSNYPVLEGVIIPGTVTSIPDESFWDCSVLKSVTIPNSVTTIGKHAFCACISLKSATIPDSVTRIGEDAFSGCRSLESLTIPESVTTIDGSAFSYCTSLESITIPRSIRKMEGGIFSYCFGLKSVTICNGVESIENSMFYDCKNIESITMPYSIKKVGAIAFPYEIKEIIVYSKDCNFDKDCGLNYTHTIYGYKGSTAEAFADEIAAKFIDVETVHKIHEYESIEDRDYCSFEICYCGEIKAVRHIDEDKDIVCDNCKKSTNHIDVGEVVYCTDVSGNLKYTAVETGTYTFKVSCVECFGEIITIVKDEKGKELDIEYGSSISYPLNKGETVYWRYICEGNSISCSLSVEHKHSYEKNETKKATCTSVGEMTYTCSCGDSYKEEIPVSGHSEVTIQGKKATCAKKGLTDGKKCSVCNKVIEEQKEIKPLGHKEVTVKAVKATYTKTGLTAGKKCKTCGKVIVKQKKVAKKKLKKVTISSVKSTKAKQANVSWKKVADATGYVVEYSTSKKFTKKTTKKVTVKKAKSMKTTLKKLKSGKKYYIRIRAYKTVSKKTVYGAYSSVKTVKIK